MRKESERRGRREPQRAQRKTHLKEDSLFISRHFLRVLCGISVSSVFLLSLDPLRLA